MCDPLTASVALTLASGGVEAIGQYQAGVYNERIADRNAQMQEAAAAHALARGGVAASNLNAQVTRTLGAQRNRLAASGVEVGEGTPLDLLVGSAQVGALDVATLEANAEREAYQYRANAAIARAQGDSARRQGTYGAVGTILTTGAQAGSSWYNGRRR